MDTSDIKNKLYDVGLIKNIVPSNIIIDKFLDDGGQGVVYKGWADGQDAAIKIYFPGQIEKRIDREISVLSSIKCYSIVNLICSCTVEIEDTILSIVATSFVNGKNLENLLKNKKINVDQINLIAYDIAFAIKNMWGYRVVHRDIKPSNILIKEDNHACLIDLSLARHIDKSSITSFGKTWGTYGYLSPEQMNAVRQLTCKSDVFSLGVVLVESFLGTHPTNYDQLRLLDLGLHENLPDEINQWEYADLLKRILHPHPTMRPRPDEILEVLSKN